jgi:tRNA (guanine26-N2/guanine27-N2)-dimethyltransferase
MAVKKTARDGILAVTSTDTASLSGTYPKTCKRKYWAGPLRNDLKHLIGLRILIRKIQLMGAQYNKALTPVLSYYKDHYFRIFFRVKKSKKECDKLLEKHNFFFYFDKKSGPLWLGKLNDNKFVKKMLNNTEKKSIKGFLSLIYEESKIDNIIFYPIHELAKELKIKNTPKNETIIKEVKKKKYKASLTHFTPYGIKTDMEMDEFLDLFKELSNK